MSKAIRIIFFWLPPVLWMGLIYFFSSFHKLQVSEVGWQDFLTRKTAHFLEYLILYLLFNRSLKNTASLALPKRLILALILTVVYAVSDEYHQTFVNGRTGKTFDILVDSIGAVSGVIFYLFANKFTGSQIHSLPRRQAGDPVSGKEGEGK